MKTVVIMNTKTTPDMITGIKDGSEIHLIASKGATFSLEIVAALAGKSFKTYTIKNTSDDKEIFFTLGMISMGDQMEIVCADKSVKSAYEKIVSDKNITHTKRGSKKAPHKDAYIVSGEKENHDKKAVEMPEGDIGNAMNHPVVDATNKTDKIVKIDKMVNVDKKDNTDKTDNNERDLSKFKSAIELALKKTENDRSTLRNILQMEMSVYGATKEDVDAAYKKYRAV